MDAATKRDLAEKRLVEKLMFGSVEECTKSSGKLISINRLSNADFKNVARIGGSKGKESCSDYTTGKTAFVRPCTVGWKSQQQPQRSSQGGGNGGKASRTPL